MKTLARIFVFAAAAAVANAQVPKLTQSIPLPGVEGRIDHLSIDVKGGRVFVAALGNNSVEVVDLKAGKVAHSLPGFSEPQGIVFVPEFNRLYVANGGGGALRVFDGTSFAEAATVNFDDDADNVRYDATAKLIYVGYGSGALGIVDATKNTIVGTIPLSAHPESFQLEKAGPRAFVNLPRSHTVAVIDRESRQVVGKWSLGMVAANFPLALDETNHRAFVATRTPARLLVFDTVSGKEIAKLEIDGDSDDVFYDEKRRQLYVVCGEGFVDVISCQESDHYTRTQQVPTRSGARTGFYAVDLDQLYVAAPKRSGRDAALQVFSIAVP